jgi:hypothetical protein
MIVIVIIIMVKTSKYICNNLIVHGMYTIQLKFTVATQAEEFTDVRRPLHIARSEPIISFVSATHNALLYMCNIQ